MTILNSSYRIETNRRQTYRATPDKKIACSRKLNTYEYLVYQAQSGADRLVAYCEVEIAHLNEHHISSITDELCQYETTDWHHFEDLFNDYGEYAGKKNWTDEDSARPYKRTGLINKLIVDPTLQGSGIAKTLLNHIYKHHFECGVFFLTAVPLASLPHLHDWKQSAVNAKEPESLLFQVIEHDLEMDTLVDIYHNLGFKYCNMEQGRIPKLYIEPLFSQPDLFKTDRLKFNRYLYEM